MTHLLSFKLRITPALYQVYGSNQGNVEAVNLEL